MKAKKATVLPDLKSSSLISLGQLCDDNCKVLLDKKKLQVFKENDVILEGIRNPKDGLWDIPIKENYVVPKSHPGLYQQLNTKRSTLQSKSKQKLMLF